MRALPSLDAACRSIYLSVQVCGIQLFIRRNPPEMNAQIGLVPFVLLVAVDFEFWLFQSNFQHWNTQNAYLIWLCLSKALLSICVCVLLFIAQTLLQPLLLSLSFTAELFLTKKILQKVVSSPALINFNKVMSALYSLLFLLFSFYFEHDAWVRVSFHFMWHWYWCSCWCWFAHTSCLSLRIYISVEFTL